ncbi:putative dispersed gene family protein 1 (DGF-1), partial [Trypanosoma cruzi]
MREGDDVTVVIASARLLVCMLAVGLWPDASACHCVYLLLFLLFPSPLTEHLELLWLHQHNYRFKVLIINCCIRNSRISGIAIYRNCVSVFAICRRDFAKRELRLTVRVRHATTALLVPVCVGGCGLRKVRVRAAGTVCGAGPLRLCVRRCLWRWRWLRRRRGCPRRMRWCCD